MKLSHPDDPKNPIQVDPDRAELYKANGWAEKLEPEAKPEK